MYLQFFWLITSSGYLSHCRHCGRIISYAPPLSAGKARKPHKDKEFCDSRCRQNYHYHNRIKPASGLTAADLWQQRGRWIVSQRLPWLADNAARARIASTIPHLYTATPDIVIASRR